MKCQSIELAEALGEGEKAFLLHSNADLDCVGSAAALAMFYGGAPLIAPEGVSHLGKRLLSMLGLEFEPDFDVEDFKRVFVLDAQDDSSLGYPGTPWDRTFIIDHHKKKQGSEAACAIVDEEASSCCEIVWDIIGRPVTVERSVGLSLMSGIVADTGHLRRAGHSTFRAVSELLEASGLRMDEVMEVFGSAEDQDISKRVSRMKGAQRARFERSGDWIVAVTEVGSFESAACHALMTVGADMAFAGSQKEGKFRIAGRANRLATIAGIHLGEMFGEMAAECSAEGGGHDGAAGLSGMGDAEAMLGICMHKALAGLRGKKRVVRPSEENVLY